MAIVKAGQLTLIGDGCSETTYDSAQVVVDEGSGTRTGPTTRGRKQEV